MLSVTQFDPKGTISEVRVHAGSIGTYWMPIYRQMLSDFMLELQRWFRSWPPATCKFSTRRSFDHHGKGNGDFVQKESFEKWKKVVSLTDLKVMKTRNDCEIACDCVKRANVVLHVGLCKEIFARKHTATHKPTSSQALIMTTMTHIHTHIHTSNRFWSPWAYGLARQ